MSTPLVYVDRSRIRQGKDAEVRTAMAELAQFVHEHEPQLVAFHAFFDDRARTMTVIHVHEDAASLDDHFRIAGPRFGRFGDLIDLERIEVYGEPSPSALARMRQKASSLGSGSVEVHEHGPGFVRGVGGTP